VYQRRRWSRLLIEESDEEDNEDHQHLQKRFRDTRISTPLEVMIEDIIERLSIPKNQDNIESEGT
jgi:hypothetical protein